MITFTNYIHLVRIPIKLIHSLIKNITYYEL